MSKRTNTRSRKKDDTVSTTLKPWPAAIIINEEIGRVRAYQIASELGAIRLGRSLFVPTQEISRRIGREVTVADVKRAYEIIAGHQKRDTLRKAAKLKGRGK